MAVAMQEQWVYDEKLNDNMVAVGFVSNPIPNNPIFENSMVLVGEKQGYLLYTDDTFPNLYEQLTKSDIRYLKIMTANQRHLKIGDDYIEVMSDDDSNLRIKLSFYKPANDFNSQDEKMSEYEKMQDLGFWCVTDEERIGGDLSCFDYPNLSVQVVDIANKNELEYQFKTPLLAKFLYYNGTHTQTTHRALPSLNSLMKIHIKTLPIQADTDTPK